MNKKRLRELLLFDQSKETIFGIIGRMDELLDAFRSEQKHRALIPFLETYYLVTKAVAHKNIANPRYYDDYAKLEQLDIHFASLYFKPLLTYLETGKAPKPWQAYFSYCKNKNGIPFLQMMLGINAHINADLCTSLMQLNYAPKKDFLRINAILEETIPEIMRYLAFHEHDVFGLGGVVFKRFVTEEFKKIVVNWRLQTWKNAQTLKKPSQTFQQTERLGRQLIEIFDEARRLQHLPEMTKRLHALKVTL